jgi:hypothetical protein
VQTSNSLTRVYGPPTLTILGTIEALTKGGLGSVADCDGGDDTGDPCPMGSVPKA